MVQAIKDRSQEKPRRLGIRPISQASSGQDADKTDRTLPVGYKAINFQRARGGLRAYGRKVDTNRQQVPERYINDSDGLRTRHEIFDIF